MVEIIHTATLVHDDIIDEAQTRRGRPAANTQWGNSKCVLAGDWLYMQAFKVAVQERNFRILDTLIELTQQMVEGELLQMEKLGKLISLDEHFDLIFRKTACLFSVCMRMGAILGGATPEQEESLGQYGRDLGMAFQIVDDVLDLTASEKCPGQAGGQRPAGRQSHDGGDPRPRALHAARAQDDRDRGAGARLRRQSPIAKSSQFWSATDRSKRPTRAPCSMRTLARNAICSFPDSEFKRALLWAPDFVVAREK